MLAKKREAVDRWESTGRSDKVAPAKDEVLEVKKLYSESKNPIEDSFDLTETFETFPVFFLSFLFNQLENFYFKVGG